MSASKGIARQCETGHFIAMSDKQIAIETIQQLPESATLSEITKRLEFVAAVRKGLEQIRCGKTVPHEQVKTDLVGFR